MIAPTDLVCDILNRHPSAWPVFERHGMCEDCKASPPPVSVHHFVDKHCEGKIGEFLSELNAAIAG